MVAIDLALSSKIPFGCSISFTGAFVPYKEKVLVSTQTQLCLIHGKEDEVLPFSHLKVSVNQLEVLGCKVESHEIEHLAHSIDLNG
jgi:phospholipase/carboxylesterase